LYFTIQYNVRRGDEMFLLIDKPKGMTSHDVVDRIRRITGERRVGHGGTLDPNATGLLIVGIGRGSTKKLGSLAKKSRKTYIAEIVLGEERDTDDSEGRIVVKARGVLPPGRKEIVELLRQFLGDQKQIPPKYSAVKVKGKKAYELARAGKKVVLKSRKVTIHRIKLISYKYPVIKIDIEVSAGTYIRAIARDVGRKLGIGGYLAELQRTKIGRFSLGKAMPLYRISRDNCKKLAIQV
jgi:tRNA pseudouridine55 synthase